MICAPYIVVVDVLCVILILHFLVADVDGWCVSVGYCVFGDRDVYESVGAGVSRYSKR